jgi:hypothetical protein
MRTFGKNRWIHVQDAAATQSDKSTRLCSEHEPKDNDGGWLRVESAGLIFPVLQLMEVRGPSFLCQGRQREARLENAIECNFQTNDR